MDGESAFAWDGTPRGAVPPPPSSRRQRPSLSPGLVVALLVVAVAAGIVVALGAFGSGSSSPTRSTFNTEIAAICGRTRAREASIALPVNGDVLPVESRVVATLSGAVTGLGALTPPAGAGAAYAAYITDMRSELGLARELVSVDEHVDRTKLSSVLAAESRLAALDKRGAAFQRDATREAKRAGVHQCNFSLNSGSSRAAGAAGKLSRAAQSAAAKDVARSAQVAVETYATDNNGSYAGATRSTLHQYESTIAIAPGGGNAWVSSVHSTVTGYSITVTPESGSERFTLTREASGAITRTCTPAQASAAGCDSGTW